MDNIKNEEYYIKKIITDLSFIIKHTKGLTQTQFENDEILIDSVMFRLIQVSENCDRLPDKFKSHYPAIPWRAMKGMRNRIVHEYGNVDMTVIYNTVKNDIPPLLNELREFDD